jgi:hypothetical protein
MKSSISGITRNILSLAVMSVPLTLLFLSACGGGGGVGIVTTPTGGGSVTTLMGGAIQGTPLSLASATVSTLAGSAGVSGYTDGTGTAATFNGLGGITTDGVNLYLVDDCAVSNDIRKIVIATGVVTTLAGSSATGAADGTGTAATFNCPWGIITDGYALYVVDSSNNTIRKIAPSSGTLSAMTSANAVVTTLAGSSAAWGAADGTGTAATFNSPYDITTDGYALYVADTGNNAIRKIAPSSGSLGAMTSANAVVTTLAGSSAAIGAADGTGTAATFNSPGGLTTNGNALYVVDYNNNKIRKIAPSSGTLSAMTSANAVVTSVTGTANTATAAGPADGTGTAATFNLPWGITTDGTNLYVGDNANNKIRMIAPTGGATLSTISAANAVVTSVTGTANTAMATGAADGAAATATFNSPQELITDGASLYVGDNANNTIRKIH